MDSTAFPGKNNFSASDSLYSAFDWLTLKFLPEPVSLLMLLLLNQPTNQPTKSRAGRILQEKAVGLWKMHL